MAPTDQSDPASTDPSSYRVCCRRRRGPRRSRPGPKPRCARSWRRTARWPSPAIPLSRRPRCHPPRAARRVTHRCAGTAAEPEEPEPSAGAREENVPSGTPGVSASAPPGSRCTTRRARCFGIGLIMLDVAGPVGRGGGGGRGRDPAQRGALPLAGPGRRPGGLGDGAGRRDEGRLAGVALDHRPVRGGVHRVRLAGVDPPRGPGAGRAGLARVRPDRQGLRRPLPDPHQGRLLPALRRASGADRAGRQDRRVGRRQHRRHQPARGRGDARPADRAAVRRGAAHRAAAAGHLDAGRGAHRRAGGRGHHRGGPDRDRRAALGGRAARARRRPAAGGQRRPARRPRLGGRPADPGVPERDDQGDRDPASGAGRGPGGPAQAVRGRAGDRSGARGAPPTSAPGSACRCWRRARRWARCGSRSAGRGRSPKRSGSSSRRWPASASSRSSGPGFTSGSTPRPRRCSAACCPDQLPSVPGLVLAAMYRPVAKKMEIGGDWYDAFRLADRRLGWRSAT